MNKGDFNQSDITYLILLILINLVLGNLICLISCFACGKCCFYSELTAYKCK